MFIYTNLFRLNQSLSLMILYIIVQKDTSVFMGKQ